MKKFTVRRFFSVYLRRKSRSKSSSLSRLEVNAIASLRAGPGARRALEDAAVPGPSRVLPIVTCTYSQTHVRELKLFGSWSGVAKIGRYCRDLVHNWPVLGLKSAPVESLILFHGLGRIWGSHWGPWTRKASPPPWCHLRSPRYRSPGALPSARVGGFVLQQPTPVLRTVQLLRVFEGA